ncbi:MAG: ribonuclease E inhibitor RraB [Verrucomicrobia bacterium]|nr:ribonuclease E inhibitor RraB [Verrucomicrobiota bacterium]
MEHGLENVKALFARMAADGWDTAAPLKWGFFFIHSSREPLLEVVAELKDYGYSVESLDTNDDGQWVLQVSKTEVLAAEKLYRRNLSFSELAEYCGVDSYDGWDVGRTES